MVPPNTPRRQRGVGSRRSSPAPPIRLALQDCAYDLLRLVAERLGWRVVGEGDGDYFE